MSRSRTDFIKKIRDYFIKLPYVKKGKSMCVCLSGGADSVALLRGLLEVSERFEFTVKACHFNHGIRGEEADRDEQFCKDLCEKLGVELYCGRDNVPAYANLHKMSIEAAARDRRYAFFERIVKKKNVDYVLTAHTMNDDAETLLLNLIRGSGSNGASAIAPMNLFTLRPMLKISREEVEAYLAYLSQDYVTDSTNASLDYTRNYIRHKIIPMMQVINPSVVDALSRYTQSCKNDRIYFDFEIMKYMNVDLRKVPKAIRDRVLIYKCRIALEMQLTSKMLDAIERVMFNNRRASVPLFDDAEAVVDQGQAVFVRRVKNENHEYDAQLMHLGENSVFDENVIIDVNNPDVEFEIANRVFTSDIISFDNIKGHVYIRNRRSGDSILIRGMHRVLKKYMIDKKIPKEYRNIIPILYDDEGIIYVPFVGIADRAVPNESTNNKKITTTFNKVDKERWNKPYEEQGYR